VGVERTRVVTGFRSYSEFGRETIVRNVDRFRPPMTAQQRAVDVWFR